jgi:hypothetical protein
VPIAPEPQLVRIVPGLHAFEARLSEPGPFAGSVEPTPAASLRYAVRADDVAAIAFLPPPDGCDDESTASEARLRAGWAALRERSRGAPPASIDDHHALVAWLSERHHLGALALIGPTLYLDEDGVPAALRFSLLDQRLGAGFLGGEHNVGSPLDRTRHAIERVEGNVRIVCWQRFGLPSPLDPRGRFHEGAPRPLGWIRVSCDIDRDGKTSAHLACSYLPTVWFYREGTRVLRADARDRSRAEIDAVLRPSIEIPSGTTHRRLDGASYRQPLGGAA